LKKLTLQDAIIEAKKRGGKCLSNQYVNTTTPLLWQCSKGHIWKQQLTRIRNGGDWCPECGGTEKKDKAFCIEIAQSKEGKLLSSKYSNNKAKLLWECKKGHHFEMSLKQVQRGFWCTQCSGKYNFKSNEEIHNLLNKKRGRANLKKRKYKISEKIEVTCANGHTWSVSLYNLFENNSWCPQCNFFRGEEVCRAIFENLTEKKFPKKRPNWLKGKKGYPLELDGYCEDLKIAFEHQGRQHYQNQLSKFSNPEILERDKLKRKLCELKGVSLIEVPEIPKMLPLEHAINYVQESLGRLGIDTSNINLKDIDISTPTDESLLMIKNIAKSKGGKCLSRAYYGRHELLDFECRVGHKWKARPSDIKRGHWCAKCSKAGGKKKTIKDMQELAKQYGGECLSTTYVNSKHKLKWRCDKGHVWESRYDSFKNKRNWCPLCIKATG
jgi:hypothetical protein